jgi:diguanylate cyclase (GGDEF)-like protein
MKFTGRLPTTSDAAGAPTVSRTQILLAEDDLGHQELLRAALSERHSVQVDVVDNGDRVIEAIHERGTNYYDCILLDFKLPDADAPELLHRLNDAGNECPTLIISSSEDQDVVIQSLRSGVVDFIPKTDAMNAVHLWSRIDLAVGRFKLKQDKRRRIVRRAQRLAHLAVHDPLTGLLNRRSIDRRLQRRRQSPDRRGDIAVLVIDLDHFKRINDTYSHDAGDRALRAVARTLQSATPRRDTVCRYGGEEFVVVQVGTSLAQSMAWAGATRAAIEQTSIDLPTDPPIHVTASIGVASGPGDALWHDTFARADRAVYIAKELGRNCVCSYEWAPILEALASSSVTTAPTPQRRLDALLDQLRHTIDPRRIDYLLPHFYKVSRIAAAVALALGQPPSIVDQLRLAGLLHDLGKLLVPYDLLAKPTPLSWQEKQLFRSEPAQSADIATRLGCPDNIVSCIRTLHAWLDTPGHSPTSLMPDPLCTRVLAVADAVAAMTRNRPFASAVSTSAALGELRRCPTRIYDSAVIEAVPHAVLHKERPACHQPDGERR